MHLLVTRYAAGIGLNPGDTKWYGGTQFGLSSFGSIGQLQLKSSKAGRMVKNLLASKACQVEQCPL